MNVPSFRSAYLFALLLVLLAIGRAQENSGRSSEKNGTLVLMVTLDDVDRTPPRDLYVEAHGYAVNYIPEKSFIVKKVKLGRYEAELPPGVYDVFVSEASSTPRCRRVLVTAGHTGVWNVMLEHDDVYSQN
jgi:hypothetical protein